MQVFVCLMLSQSFLKLSFFGKKKKVLTFCWFNWLISISLSSRSLILLSVLANLLLIPSRVFFISVTAFFRSAWFFINSPVLPKFLYSTLKFGEHSHSHLSLCQANYFHFIRVSLPPLLLSWGFFLLFFHLRTILLSSHFVWLPMFISVTQTK